MQDEENANTAAAKNSGEVELQPENWK
jgi:hypothetical protein